jgi:AAA family ATP:ADP antiporter
VRVEGGELRPVLWSCAYFFCLLSSYFILRPLREAGASADRGALNALFLATLAGTLVANPLFAALVARFPRRVFIPIVNHFFAANMLVFCALLLHPGRVDRAVVSRVFFVWLSVFNLFVVSVFWGLMADLWRNEQGKRLFGLIGVGGTVGALAGAGLTALLAKRMPPDLLLLPSAALLEGGVLCVRRLVRIFGLGAPEAGSPPRVPRQAEVPVASLLDGVRLVVRSPYLLALCGFVLLFTVSSTFLWFQQATIGATLFDNARDRTVFFARIDLGVQVLTVLLQGFATSRVFAWFGVGGALALLPAITLVGFLALAAMPTARTLVLFVLVRRATEYGISKPARDVLFTVVPREEKYVAKNFVDTFVYRFGDAVGSGVDFLLRRFVLGMGAVASAFAPFCGLWVLLAIFLGRRQRARAASEGAPG